MTCSESALHNPPSHPGGTLVSVADLPPATIVVRGDTHIVCQASAAGDCTINFANRPAVFAIERGANLTFRQITMNNFHSSVSDEAKQLVIKPSALSVWPTILVENGSTVRCLLVVGLLRIVCVHISPHGAPRRPQVGFINSSLTNVSPFCGENTYPIILASYRRTFGDSNVVPLQDGRILVMGEHWASYNLVNTTANASGMAGDACMVNGLHASCCGWCWVTRCCAACCVACARQHDALVVVVCVIRWHAPHCTTACCIHSGHLHNPRRRQHRAPVPPRARFCLHQPVFAHQRCAT